MDAYCNMRPQLRIANRTDEHLLNSRRMRLPTIAVHNPLFTEDCAHSTPRQNRICSGESTSSLPSAATLGWLSTRTERWLNIPQSTPRINANSTRRNTVDSSACLGNALPRCVKKKRRRSGSSDIQSQLGLHVLPNAVWSRHGLHLNEAVILTALLYGAETWIVYTKQELPSEIPRRRWQKKTLETNVLERHPQHPPPAMLRQSQLRWSGHLVSIRDERLPKQLL
ncbi:hypothetical protein SprV_0301033000 [Sparganum proliferum]